MIYLYTGAADGPRRGRTPLDAAVSAAVGRGQKNTYLLRCHFVLKVPSFYQDRLGTNIGKATFKKREMMRFLEGL